MHTGFPSAVMAVLLPSGHAARADPTHKAVARRKNTAYLAMIFLSKNNTNAFGEYVQKRYGIVSVRLCRICQGCPDFIAR